jgi:hypothetical protein
MFYLLFVCIVILTSKHDFPHKMLQSLNNNTTDVISGGETAYPFLGTYIQPQFSMRGHNAV